MLKDNQTIHRLTVVSVGAFCVWMLSFAAYSLCGHELIRAMYEGRSIAPLNAIVMGQAVHSVDFYQNLADGMVLKSLVLFLVFELILVALALSKGKTVRMLFVLPVGLYLLGMSQTLVGGDGDEFLVQAFRLGNTHAPGNPVYLFAGKLFLIVTNGSLMSLNLLSMVFSLLALWLLWKLVRSMGASETGAVVSVMVLAFAPVFWMFALKSEVYNVNAVFLLGVLLILYRWSSRARDKDLFLAGWLYGISLGVYFGNILLLLPALLFACWKCEGGKRFRLLAVTAICAAAGYTPSVLYLLFRSRVEPAIGCLHNPDSLKGLFLYLSGNQFGALQAPDIGFVIKRVLGHFGIMAVSFAVIGLVPACIGARQLWKKDKQFALLLMFMAVLTWGYFTVYRVGDYFTMPTIAYIVMALFVGFGIEYISSRGGRQRVLAGMMVALIVTFQMMVPPALFDDFKYERDIEERCKWYLNGLPPESTLFAPWSDFTSLLCVQSIQGVRQDVKIYERSSQARLQRVGEDIVAVHWHDYIDEHVGDTNSPIFVTASDEYLDEKYDVKRTDNGLFRIMKK